MSAKNRPYFVFYDEMRLRCRLLPAEAELSLLRTIIAYALDGVEPQDLHPLATEAWQGVVGLLRKDRKQWENGSKGGRPRKNPNENPNKNPPVDRNPNCEATYSPIPKTQIKTQNKTQMNQDNKNPNENPPIDRNANSRAEEKLTAKTQTETQNEFTLEREEDVSPIPSSPHTPYLPIPFPEEEKDIKKGKVRARGSVKGEVMIPYAERVYLYPSRYEALCKEFTKELVDETIQELDAYKEATGRKYKSDAGAIRQFILRRKRQEAKWKTKPHKETRLEQLQTPNLDASTLDLIRRGKIKPPANFNPQQLNPQQ